MKAFVLHQIGDFRLENAADPKPKEGETLVEVKATGICGSDIPRIYQSGTYSYPLIPGHEFSGVVRETKAATDSRWLDKRVGVFPLIPCRRCAPCLKSQYEMCRNYSYLGSRRNGGFAQYVAVPTDNLIELPESVNFTEAAMLEPMAVAVHAMRRVKINPSDTAVVCGLGTIGLLLLMFLIESGVSKIFALGNKEFQRQTAKKLGLPDGFYCDIRNQDVEKWIQAQTNGLGADVFFECVGKNETLCQAVEFTAPGGKVMLIGNPHAHMALEKQIYWKILRNQLTIAGTWNSSFTHDPKDDWHYALDRLSQKRISPTELISHTFPLEELEQGFRIMRDKTEDYGKIMGIVSY
ncbi:MAG: galactitol-1-phosphate 5-dehydrogenase [Lachnospiraceae bacterium]|nr:galactitol-1-phosphate 5-dehydrogenase [Lachnospiraceae bacterium]